MFNTTKAMLETIQNQAKTIADLARENEALNDVRYNNHMIIEELQTRVQKLENILCENKSKN